MYLENVWLKFNSSFCLLLKSTLTEIVSLFCPAVSLDCIAMGWTSYLMISPLKNRSPFWLDIIKLVCCVK